MASRAEIASKYAKSYAAAGKRDTGRILGEVISVTGWSRDNARRRLTGAPRRPSGGGRAGREEAEEAAFAEVLLRG